MQTNRWGLRASWLAQELLSTFNNNEIQEVALLPVYDISGAFIVKLNEEVIWDRRSTTTPGLLPLNYYGSVDNKL